MAVNVELLQDITLLTESSTPEQFAVGDETLFFTAIDGSWGLYASDATSAGTLRLTSFSERPQQLTAIGDSVYFTVHDGNFGNELWRSDGTVEGTGIVKDIAAGPMGSVPRGIMRLGSTLIFFTSNGDLWKTDGTDAGTVRIKNVASSNGVDIRRVASMNGVLYFFLSNRFLWQTDGTEEGTHQIANVPLESTINTRAFAQVNDRFFFISGERALWTSDGTPNGTAQITDPNYEVGSIAGIDGSLYAVQRSVFAPGQPPSVWKGNGVSFPMTQLRSFSPGAQISIIDGDGGVYVRSSDSGLWKVVEGGMGYLGAFSMGVTVGHNGNLYFSANIATTVQYGDLWKSDGTAAGTRKVASIGWPNYETTLNHFFVFDDRVYFTGNDYLHGTEIFQTDGTIEGTHLAIDVNRNTRGSGITGFAKSNGRVFFAANDWLTPGVNVPPVGAGSELYVTDGSADGTGLLRDISPGPPSSFPTGLTDVNGTLFFLAAGALWKSDGTAAGTTLIKSLADGFDVDTSTFTNFNGTLFFARNDNVVGRELWMSDGTQTGTVLVSDINPNGGSFPGNFTVFKGQLYFTAFHPTTGGEVWRSDGTTTALAADVTPGTAGGSLSRFTVVEDKMFFEHTNDLWMTTGNGATRVRSMSQISSIVSFDGQAYVVNNGRIWTSNGTMAGTVQFSPHLNVSRLTVVGPYLYFFSGSELWRTSGSLASTKKIADFKDGQAAAQVLYVGGGLDVLYVAVRMEGKYLDLWQINNWSATASLVGRFPWHFESNTQIGLNDGNTLYLPLSDARYGAEPHLVRPVANTPNVSHSVTLPNVQSVSGLVVTRNAADGIEVSLVKISEIENGRVYLHDGVTEVVNGQFVPFEEAARGFRFTPVEGFVGTASFKVQASTSASEEGLGGEVVTATITVLPGLGTTGDDDLTLRASSDGAMLEVFNGNPPAPGATPIFSWPMDTSVALPIDTLAGDDTVVVELPAGANGPGAGIRLEAGTGVNRLLVKSGSVRIDSAASGGTLDSSVADGAQLLTTRLSQNGLAISGSGKVTILPGGTQASVITSLDFLAMLGGAPEEPAGAAKDEVRSTNDEGAVSRGVVSGEGSAELSSASVKYEVRSTKYDDVRGRESRAKQETRAQETNAQHEAHWQSQRHTYDAQQILSDKPTHRGGPHADTPAEQWADAGDELVDLLAVAIAEDAAASCQSLAKSGLAGARRTLVAETLWSAS